MIDLRSALRLYLVADPEHCRGDLAGITEAAIRGGVSMVQLRAKQLPDPGSSVLAQALCNLCHAYGIPFIMNDRVDIAIAVGADGVHLGVDDTPIELARALGGDDFIIGYSPDSDEDLERAAARGANYLGIGPVFGTKTKSDAGAALGIDEFRRRMQLGGLPTVGIGGVTSTNYREVLLADADGVAVISAILGADNPEATARQLSTN
ncbi:MAG: thiamine phosphate synthase [Thermomicrobiales bacterium]|nr:thiamine phosphate synthase [Thermomicrobiales bacterium]